MNKKEAPTKRQLVNIALGKALARAKDGANMLRRLLKAEPLTGENSIQDDPEPTSSESDLN